MRLGESGLVSTGMMRSCWWEAPVWNLPRGEFKKNSIVMIKFNPVVNDLCVFYVGLS